MSRIAEFLSAPGVLEQEQVAAAPGPGGDEELLDAYSRDVVGVVKKVSP